MEGRRSSKSHHAGSSPVGGTIFEKEKFCLRSSTVERVAHNVMTVVRLHSQVPSKNVAWSNGRAPVYEAGLCWFESNRDDHIGQVLRQHIGLQNQETGFNSLARCQFTDGLGEWTRVTLRRSSIVGSNPTQTSRRPFVYWRGHPVLQIGDVDSNSTWATNTTRCLLVAGNLILDQGAGVRSSAA